MLILLHVTGIRTKDVDYVVLLKFLADDVDQCMAILYSKITLQGNFRDSLSVPLFYVSPQRLYRVEKTGVFGLKEWCEVATDSWPSMLRPVRNMVVHHKIGLCPWILFLGR